MTRHAPAPAQLELSIRKKLAQLTYLIETDGLASKKAAMLKAEIERDYWVLNTALAQSPQVK